MAKYRHRVFEMYEFRDEAIIALTPKENGRATEAAAQEPGATKHFAVSYAAHITVVEFQSVEAFIEETANELRSSFTQFADMLDKDSKVLLDFTGVTTFNANAINELAIFKRKLQIKGSRIALCCLAPTVHKSFFRGSNGHEDRT